MTGKYRIRVENGRLIYDFEIRRNITIIRGNSGTGKTTLIEMIRSYERDGEESGIQIRSEKTCTVLDDIRWEENLRSIRESIVFIDEDYRFVRTPEFAAAIRESDNYYVLVTRDNLETLPYSVDEIYGIRTSGKYQGLKKAYHELYRIYADLSGTRDQADTACLITEDSNAGNDFFTAAAGEGVRCISAGGKSGIYARILADPDAVYVVIADGAAFGPEMERMMELVRSGYKILLFLPESFEWIILRSGMIRDGQISTCLAEPENYADSTRYFSWERYFTALLVEKTAGTYLQYTKRKLNPVYLHRKEMNAILRVLPEQVRKYLKAEDEKGEE